MKFENTKMDQKVFSKTTVTNLSNAFSNFKIKQERGKGRKRPIIDYTFTFDKEKSNQYEINPKKEEAISKLWKTDKSEPMPSAVTQTEYKNPELRKEQEKNAKHKALFEDLFKGWFK